MAKDWKDSEIDSCTRTYLWMQKAFSDGFKPVKARLCKGLIEGPLSGRTLKAIEYRFQNISAVLDARGEQWIQGYPPAKNVGALKEKRISEFIEAFRHEPNCRKLDWLIQAVPAKTVQDAGRKLASGREFAYPKTAEDDLKFEGVELPLKKVMGFASFMHFGAPLFPENFSFGEGSPCFRKLAESGLTIDGKKDFTVTNVETTEFRKSVSRYRELVSDQPPEGNPTPKTFSHLSDHFRRDASVAAFVENRANGFCELCGQQAPFARADGTPFLEVHHIVPLSAGGSDTVDNTAALCPNCHRACHYGGEASLYNETLSAKFMNLKER